ncbi:MAG TPA: nitrilase family protein, partial [Alistipes sp.]|nr:nitrilase family protein [Alistipes sp.]
MNLRVSLCQTEAAWRDPIGNLRRAEPLVAAAAADLVVLPELFATGFDVAAAAAEPEGGPVAGAL